MKTSEKGIALIKEFEGFRTEPYKDAVGVWTIGYGTTRGINDMSPPVTREEATALLREDVQKFESTVNHSVLVPLNQNQFDALISFTYNIGSNAFLGSTLLKRLNEGNYRDAAKEFKRWKFAKKKELRGLVRRRKAESELFQKPLKKSRTVAGQAAVGVGLTGSQGADMLAADVQTAADNLSFFAEYHETIKYIFIGLTVLGVGITLYAAWSRRRQGIE